MKTFLQRVQPPTPPLKWLFAGAGGMIAIAVVAALSVYAEIPLLMAPFGASCVLLFALPDSPLSQPMNVVGGHLLATGVGLIIRYLFPDSWWAVAVAVGISISLMAALRVTHPPAGADPVVVFAGANDISYLLFPVLSGAITIVASATLFHRLTGTQYPLKER